MANYTQRCKICGAVLTRRGLYCKAHRDLSKIYGNLWSMKKTGIPSELHGKAFQDAFDKAFGLEAL